MSQDSQYATDQSVRNVPCPIYQISSLSAEHWSKANSNINNIINDNQYKTKNNVIKDRWTSRLF